jgi:hypothetical protein
VIESTIYLRLLDEKTDVWRPVVAERLGATLYRILDQVVPAEERWEFGPAELVVTDLNQLAEGPTVVAIARASR